MKKPKRVHRLKIKYIWWYPNNNKFLTAGEEGMVFEWTIHQNKINTEKVISNILNIYPNGSVNSVFAT